MAHSIKKDGYRLLSKIFKGQNFTILENEIDVTTPELDHRFFYLWGAYTGIELIKVMSGEKLGDYILQKFHTKTMDMEKLTLMLSHIVVVTETTDFEGKNQVSHAAHSLSENLLRSILKGSIKQTVSVTIAKGEVVETE